MFFSKEYIDYVIKTANQKYTVEMAACALMEEMLEFDSEPSIDELGDIYYQFILFAYLTGINLDTLQYVEHLRDSIKCMLAITSQFKKRTTRNKELDYDVIDKYINCIYSDIQDATTQINADVREVEKYNMTKLDKRYETIV